MENKINILMLGPPGSGKGTQCRILSESYSALSVISTGDLLRDEAKLNTDIALKIRNIMKSGNLVDDELVCQVFLKSISKIRNGFLLDGFPRNLNQAQFLTKVLKEYDVQVDIVIQLQLDLETIKNRLAGRVFCKNCGNVSNFVFFNKKVDEIICKVCKSDQLDCRYDDKVEIIVKRVLQYNEEIKRLEVYYGGKVVKIDAGKSIEEVSSNIKEKIEHLIID